MIKKAEHMMSKMTMTQLIAYQNEYTQLSENNTSTTECLDRLGLLEIIFEKVDLGKIKIASA
jgi:hypothetical protein